MWYFAFGSNMDSTRMDSRRVVFTAREHGMLRDWELTFDKQASGRGEGYATIAPAQGKVVEGVLYRVTDAGLAALDRFEGVPTHYSRVQLPIRRRNGQMILAWCYLARPAMIDLGRRPSRAYLGHLLGGRDLLSAEYTAALEAIETVEGWRAAQPIRRPAMVWPDDDDDDDLFATDDLTDDDRARLEDQYRRWRF